MAEVADIVLPTLHPDQLLAYKVVRANRFVALRCGRRWGKTDFDKTVICDDAIKGKSVGWFAPEYKFISEAYNEISEILQPVIKQSSKTEGVIRCKTGGRIDFWSLENERAGRSRKYHRVVIDEGAFAKENMLDIWEKSIKPTLLDYGGKAIVSSNTNGIDPKNFLYAVCNDKKYGFVDFHAPTHNNPYLKREEVAKLQGDNHPLVYQQEYLAEFVDWSGAAFFGKDKLLYNDDGVPFPTKCDYVFATVDSATKTGSQNDGTAVVYFAVIKHGLQYQLVVLDWDVVQVEGDLLIKWLPGIFGRLNDLAGICRAKGNAGTFIEDKSSGMVLIQHGKRNQWPTREIDSKLTSVGKDERAISVSGYHHRNKVKLSKEAYDKVTNYKGTTRNHFLGQVVGFRIGDKEARRRDDDLLDCYCYGIALSLGDSGGF